MKPVRTHTFNGRKYKIESVERINGVTDLPGDPKNFEMLVLEGNDLRALHSAIHEGLEGIGCCDKCIHEYNNKGLPKTWDVAKFLWRLGYRKSN